MNSVEVKLNDGTVEHRLIIYTITSYFIQEISDNHRLDYVRDSFVGFYTDLDRAKTCVVEDRAGFSEAGYYNYVCVHTQAEGLYNLALWSEDSEQIYWWYKHNDETNKWEPCEDPWVTHQKKIDPNYKDVRRL